MYVRSSRIAESYYVVDHPISGSDGAQLENT